MQPAQIPEAVSGVDRESRTAEIQPATADAAIPLGDRFVLILFLLGLALFGFILVIDLVGGSVSLNPHEGVVTPCMT